MGDSVGFFKYIGPVGRTLGLLPILNVMTRRELVESIEGAGFSLAHNWQPGRNKAVFIVAQKAGG